MSGLSSDRTRAAPHSAARSMSSRADPHGTLRAARDEPQSRRYATRNACAARTGRNGAASPLAQRSSHCAVALAASPPSRASSSLSGATSISAPLSRRRSARSGQSPSTSHCDAGGRLGSGRRGHRFAPDQTMQPVSRLLVWTASHSARAEIGPRQFRRLHPVPPPLPGIARHIDHPRRMRGVSAPLDGTPAHHASPPPPSKACVSSSPRRPHGNAGRVRRASVRSRARGSDAGRVPRIP